MGERNTLEEMREKGDWRCGDGLLGSYRRENKRWRSADYCGRNERLSEGMAVRE